MRPIRSCAMSAGSGGMARWSELSIGARSAAHAPRPFPRRGEGGHGDAASSLLHERALALAQGTEGLIGGDHGELLVIVERVLRFGRRLHLEEIHVAHHAAVLAQL